MTDQQTDLYPLPEGHPGAGDDAYRRRRAVIAAALADHRPGDTIPLVEYTEEEDAVWEVVSAELAAKHERLACAAYLDAAARLELPAHEVPQLREVDARLRSASGFGLRPVAGLVPARTFYAALAERTFLSTQYIRHHSTPYYTPEPDIVHEIIGHARALAGVPFAALYEAAGRASLRATTDQAADFFSRVFWFSLEFGVVREDGELKAYGAGLLSSFGEIEEFRHAEVRPFDIPAMGVQPYDITRYQDVLFAADSFGQIADELLAFFDGFDDDRAVALGATGARR
jgi:phenylalanine-4-hydroxylase